MKLWLFIADCLADFSPPLRRGEVEDERDASGIAEPMNFTGEAAPRTAKSLFAFPFAPADVLESKPE
jgi:hypothetical protein